MSDTIVLSKKAIEQKIGDFFWQKEDLREQYELVVDEIDAMENDGDTDYDEYYQNIARKEKLHQRMQDIELRSLCLHDILVIASETSA
jgi:hypothetical protein